MSADVHVIATSSLGDHSYLATDGQSAVVVDPQRDVDRVLSLAGRTGVRVTHVVETHLHNDYVSGGLELARLTGAHYGVAAADQAPFPHLPLSDGDVVEVSPVLRLRALATPGHTFHHLSYVLEHREAVEGVFTGGSLLFGTTGRTDLLGAEHAATLAREQHASVRRLSALLPGGAAIWPTHGFGSFCSAAQASGDSSTIERERQVNPALRLAADAFVTQTLAGLDAYPAYYAHMGVLNLRGPAPVDLRPPALISPEELRARLRAGEWVVDLRHRTAYAEAHLAGTISLGLDGPMATWLGWLIGRGAPLTLVGRTPEEVAQARRELVRIGVDHVSAAAAGTPRALAADPAQVRSLPTATFAGLAAALAGDVPAGLPAPRVILDVRLGNEWRASHLDGAVHVPLPELAARAGDIPAGAVWVHCGSGYRATAAASLLARSGREVVVVDDEFAGAASSGLAMAS
ncbi:MBL fold metallo-hydrolase [Nonomuraea rubra]|uniref:Glyoxylase-like metal-dependent hydrolase (Beta-lactamase superfamily II)/rhodanese-related sulfurtransferase n=1 Tax=Nonomuraea rubra TaxID=46180 RepID=A0A7X0U3M4_9ACTN|nr:MBL fold metallo-hydrolase [Nonomuraea rubra]MBB6553649.1 glyoxylase-like metal-dependent hydrolase (beta-lactamase superfamily II)/rhodanese-related sulfurtransferase [Nonomuraea rubra]